MQTEGTNSGRGDKESLSTIRGRTKDSERLSAPFAAALRTPCTKTMLDLDQKIAQLTDNEHTQVFTHLSIIVNYRNIYE